VFRNKIFKTSLFESAEKNKGDNVEKSLPKAVVGEVAVLCGQGRGWGDGGNGSISGCGKFLTSFLLVELGQRDCLAGARGGGEECRISGF
jgi:hypothetical protein